MERKIASSAALRVGAHMGSATSKTRILNSSEGLIKSTNAKEGTSGKPVGESEPLSFQVFENLTVLTDRRTGGPLACERSLRESGAGTQAEIERNVKNLCRGRRLPGAACHRLSPPPP